MLKDNFIYIIKFYLFSFFFASKVKQKTKNIKKGPNGDDFIIYSLPTFYSSITRLNMLLVSIKEHSKHTTAS